jgi:hypothetical protein
MPLTITHFTTDSLPRVVTGAAGTSTLDVLLPFRVDLDDPALTVTGWSLDVDVDGRSWRARVRTRRLRPGLAEALRERMARTGVFTFDHLPYYAGLHDDEVRAGRAAYLECRMPGVAPGAAVTYTLSVTVCRDGGQPQVLTTPIRTLHAVHPRFTHDDVRRIHTPGAFHAGEAWVLHHRRAGGLDQFRIDVADLGWAPERAELVVQVGGTVVDLAAGRYPTLPLVDLAADSVSFAVPHDGDVLPSVTVR